MNWWGDGVLDRERYGGLVEGFLERIVLARDRDRLPQGLLMVGPPGFGRELAAVEAAVLMTCADAMLPWSEGSCCDRVRRGLHPDVAAVLPQPPAGRIKIAQVRDVVNTASARPYEGLRRIWIFDGVEAGRFGAEAANAFLKILEEPPEHVRFLLLAANPAAVLPTIRSRCQLLALPGPLAVAAQLSETVSPELLASAIDGHDVGMLADRARAALGEAMTGETSQLVGLSSQADDGAPMFEIVAAVAVEMAAEGDDGDRTEELVRLAADLLRTERRARGLNLDRGRQLTSCLLRWHVERG
jgi:hypothetical protein